MATKETARASVLTRAGYPFAWPFRVRYAEVDGQGVVFNAHYLTYYDTAITEYLRWLPFEYGLGGIPGTDEDFHLVKSVVEYRAPIRFDDDIEVFVRTGRMGRTSVSFELGVFPKDEDGLLATGEIIWVNTNQKTMKSTPLPPDLIEVIKKREPSRFEN